MTKLHWTGLAVLVGGLAVGLVLSSAPEERPRPAAKAPTADTRAQPSKPPPGAIPLFAPRAQFRFAIFHLPEPKAPVMARLDDLKSGAFKGLPVVDEPKDGDPPPYLSVRVLPVTQFPLPIAGHLTNASRKLSPDVQSTLHTSRQVTVLEVHTAPPALGLLRQVYALVLELAEATGGVIWDEQSGELLEPTTWKAQRLRAWSGDVPLVMRHITVNAFRDGEDRRVRLVTQGMGKLGLPDLRMENVPQHLAQQMASVINLAAQVVVETGALSKEGELLLDVNALKHEDLRASIQQTQARTDARLRANLTVSIGPPVEQVRNNRLMVLSCAAYPGKVPSEQQESFLAELYGTPYRMTPIDRDEEMLALSRRQVEKLKQEVKPRFLKGLGDLEQLLVRAPFKTSSGDTEWLWVLVERWEGTTLRGLLHDAPRDVPQLRAGSPVTVPVDEVFDYSIEGRDGRREGNETGWLKSKRFGKQPD
ncbi:MAG TPA: DUF2314 domain-containing protein [Myxococcaceae bacterium]|nr:DUF2314 domain-containing protein [Myxococcaceae bacterium]